MLLRPLPEPMLNGGSTMQWSMQPSGHERISSRQSPVMMRLGVGGAALDADRAGAVLCAERDAAG